MKNQIIFISLFFCGVISKAQSNITDPIILNVTYTFIHVNNLNDIDNPIKKDMVLSVGKNSSRYISASLYNASLAPPPKAMLGARAVVGRPIVMVNNQGAIINESYMQYPNTETLQIIAVIGNNEYLTETKATNIGWKLENQTKEIGGFRCQKAIGNYAGRTYIAWFAPDLPFRNGPFKLWGLPGLILEVEDTKNEVKFLFKEINKETDNTKKVELLSPPIKITLAEYNKAKRMYLVAPDTYMQSQIAVGSPKVTKVSDGSVNSKNYKDNPIELKP